VRLHRAASLTLTVRDGRNKVVRKGLSIRLRKVGDNKNPGWARRSKPPGPKGTTHVFPELRHGLYNLVVGYKGHISRTRSIRIRGDRKLNIRLRARRRRK